MNRLEQPTTTRTNIPTTLRTISNIMEKNSFVTITKVMKTARLIATSINMANTVPKNVSGTFQPTTWLLFSLILIEMFSFGMAAPISSSNFVPTKQNPCGRDLTNQGEAHNLPFHDIIKNNRAVVEDTLRDVQRLQSLYEGENTSWNVNKYSDTSRYRLRGLLTDSNTAPADSDDESVWNNTQNLEAVFTKHHKDTTLLITYIRQAIDEQNQYDSGFLVPQLETVESALLGGVLCGHDTALRFMDHPVTTYADEDDIPSSLHDQSLRTRRYVRDLIVANNIHTQLSLMKDYYNQLTSDDAQT